MFLTVMTRARGTDVLAVYRLNTFPLIHMGFFHAFLNLLALTPLMERFEGEYGTLTSLALFFGRKYSPLTDLPDFPLFP